MKNYILDKIYSIKHKTYPKYYVVDPIDDFTYSYGTRKECQELINWLQDNMSAGAIYAIYKKSQLTPMMLQTLNLFKKEM